MAKTFFSNVSPREQLGKLIEDVANSGVRELKKNDLKDFKSLCKSGDDDLIDFVYRLLIIQLEKNHCQKRYSSVLLIEQLFPRSHRFRTVFTNQANLTTFFQLTLGTEKDLPLPKPKAYQRLLKEKVNQLINEWIQKFGLGYPYLEQVYKLALSLISSSNDNETRPVNLPVQVQNEIRMIDQIDRKLLEYSSVKDELSQLLVQFRSCFELIIPEDEFSLNEMDESEEIDEEMGRLITTKSVRQQVSITLKPYLKIKINENNANTIVTLKDLYRQLIEQYVPKIKSLLKYLSKGGRRCEDEVKQLIKLKDETLKLVSMYTELRFTSDDQDELSDESNDRPIELIDESTTDDDDFEEVKEKDIEEEIPPERWTEYGIENPFVNKYSNNDDSNKPSTSGLTNSTYYDPNACNVKLKNGTLCPRKDKKICPFHGQIIERDHDGKPVDDVLRKHEEEEEIRRQNDWQDPVYLKELENQIGIDLTIKKVKVKKNPELLNLKTCDETPKSRLMKKMKVLKR